MNNSNTQSNSLLEREPLQELQIIDTSRYTTLAIPHFLPLPLPKTTTLPRIQLPEPCPFGMRSLRRACTGAYRERSRPASVREDLRECWGIRGAYLGPLHLVRLFVGNVWFGGF